MLILLAKRKPCSSFLSLFATQHNFRPCSSSSPQNPHFNISDYLISSFGFSADKAGRLSKRLSHLKSPQNPDSVRRFLHQQGFSDTDMSNLITRCPRILCSSPDNTLAPNLTALRDIGLSTTTVTQLILSSPNVLMFCSAASIVKFWLDLFGRDEETLVRAVRRHIGIVTHDISRIVAPNISILRSHGLSTGDVQRIAREVPRLITYRVSLLDDMLNRAKELGFHPGSTRFLDGLHALCCNSREGLRKKMELFGKFKWSEEEFLAALWRAPLWARLSEKTLQAKMDFFIGEAVCDPSYVAANPTLLAYSLEKRLRPRVRVLNLLESKDLCRDKRGFYNKISLSNMKFVEIYVSPHKEEIPELLEAYRPASTSCSG